MSKLSRVLCSFLLKSDEAKCSHPDISPGKIVVSSAYSELSVKWVMRMLNSLFPCIKACSNQTVLPRHLRYNICHFETLLVDIFILEFFQSNAVHYIYTLSLHFRIFVNTLQFHTLSAFKTLLSLIPTLLEVFREERLWELIFSENFFYFGPTLQDDVDDFFVVHKDSKSNLEVFCASVSTSNVSGNNCENLQVEVISFVEFAATSSGIAHNLVGYIYLKMYSFYNIFQYCIGGTLLHIILCCFDLSGLSYE